MTNEKIIEMAAKAAENYREGDFFIGAKVDEVLPNDKITTLICVDCSWLKTRQSTIVDRNDLDIINDVEPSIKIDIEDIILTYWFDAVDSDGDIHHCKLESFITMSEDPFNPVEGTDWALYIEL